MEGLYSFFLSLPIVSIDFGTEFLQSFNRIMGMFSLAFVSCGLLFMTMSRDADDRTGVGSGLHVVGFGVASLVIGGWPLLLLLCFGLILLWFDFGFL